MSDEEIRIYSNLIEEIEKLGFKNWENPGYQVPCAELVEAYEKLKSSYDLLVKE